MTAKTQGFLCDSSVCETLLSSLEAALSVRRNIQGQVIERMPHIIADQLESVINDALEGAHDIDGIEVGVCYTEMLITDTALSLAAMLVTRAMQMEMAWNATEAEAQTVRLVALDGAIAEFETAESVTMAGGDAGLLEMLFVLCVVASVGVGTCCGYGIVACVYAKKFKELRCARKGDRNEQEPMINQ